MLSLNCTQFATASGKQGDDAKTRDKRPRWNDNRIMGKILKVIGVGTGLLVLFIAVQLWPIAFLSQGVCLTGQTVNFQKVFSARDPGREGYYVVVSRLSAADAQRLQRQALAAYPMWSPGAVIDSYRRVTWQSKAELAAGPHAETARRALDGASYYMDPEDLKTRSDVFALARFLSDEEGALVAGEIQSPANYRIYVLDLQRGILVTIILLS